MSKPKKASVDSIFTDAPATVQLEERVRARTDRTGRQMIPFWAPTPARKQLRVMAAEANTTQQELMTIALNDFFRKHGKEPIA
jgi:hypothetical protein